MGKLIQEIAKRLFSTPEAAAYLGVKPSTLVVWRCTDRYPLRYRKIGSRVFYLLEDLEEFITKRSSDKLRAQASRTRRAVPRGRGRFGETKTPTLR